MEALIKIAFLFTALSVITLLIYVRHAKSKGFSKLSLDTTSILVYILAAGFFVTAFIYFLSLT
ncbi:MAG: hypothetical protein ACYDEQ_14490 [Desulfocucumaceae bacterium]